jgi:hypothetical protein
VRDLGHRGVALLIALGFRLLVEQMNLLMVAQRHIRQVLVHAWFHSPERLLLAVKFHVHLNLLYLLRGYVLANLNKS